MKDEINNGKVACLIQFGATHQSLEVSAKSSYPTDPLKQRCSLAESTLKVCTSGHPRSALAKSESSEIWPQSGLLFPAYGVNRGQKSELSCDPCVQLTAAKWKYHGLIGRPPVMASGAKKPSAHPPLHHCIAQTGVKYFRLPLFPSNAHGYFRR